MRNVTVYIPNSDNDNALKRVNLNVQKAIQT